MEERQQYIGMLDNILDKQIATLEDILAVTKEQSLLASDERFDMDKFDETLARKDVFIMRLNELDNGFVFIYDRVRSEVKNNPEKFSKDIKRLQEKIRKCTDFGMEIQTLEARNRDKFVKCFDNKRQEYSAKQTAATVAGKYNVMMRNANYAGGNRFNFNQ